MLLVAAALILITVGGAVLLAAGTILGCMAYRELMAACSLETDGRFRRLVEITGYVLVVILHVLIYISTDTFALFIWVALSVIVYLSIYVFTYPAFMDNQIRPSLFCLLYGPFLLSFVSLTRNAEMGAVTVWIIFISSSVCDVGAYCVGVLFGKHKLAPVLSPKKTIEGAVGGVVTAALGGYLYALWAVYSGSIGQEAYLLFPVFCGICSVFSMVGDLAASAIKRDHIIKDYGSLIPGHGGIMDRFDSVLFTAPATYIATMIWFGGIR